MLTSDSARHFFLTCWSLSTANRLLTASLNILAIELLLCVSSFVSHSDCWEFNFPMETMSLTNSWCSDFNPKHFSLNKSLTRTKQIEHCMLVNATNIIRSYYSSWFNNNSVNNTLVRCFNWIIFLEKLARFLPLSIFQLPGPHWV